MAADIAEKDYYGILGVSNKATSDEIVQSYREFAIKLHPDKNVRNRKAADEQFQEVSEAFEVLSDANKKKVYDRFGNKGLAEAAERLANESQTATADEIYASLFTGQPVFSQRPQGPNVDYSMWCSLLDLYYGCTKKMKWKRTALNAEREPYTIFEVLEIPVKRGWRADTKILFYNSGNETQDRAAGNLVVTVKERRHKVFTRQVNDLVMTKEVSLQQALCGAKFDVKTLDGRTVAVEVSEVITPDYVTVIPGEGMPLPKAPNLRGNLLVKYKINFPNDLSTTCRQSIGSLLTQETQLETDGSA
mmetsp:Transcript_30242/g.36731  ORF Transcript_30242/g.36731 Transcript_30242/m.36731 type:complete len:304 (+) Transcript_30242:342-1253(+)|eukprot:CAMPEP_0197864532 /NCGR_PEP_ID=MMETSP1438-20131217/42842_1 /TAXON_ID=1461541 /ORGANISM="Pterosperma sp., Strain CCMP1384" /LENGTH=303 /DNA_ID=CAMNT_0043482811 /DNA_START=341 /DNA_END=1252 /DNA_ORIENTATION=+